MSQPKKSLFAAYSNNDNNNDSALLLEGHQKQQSSTATAPSSWLSNLSFKEKKEEIVTSTPPLPLPSLKKKASDFFNLSEDNATSITSNDKQQQQLQPKKETKKRSSFLEDDDRNSDESDSSDSSDDGFTYNRKKYRKEEERARKKERKEKKKKKKEENRLILANELFENKNKEDYYIEKIGDRTNYTIGIINKSTVPNYDYDNFNILGLNDCKIGFSKKEGYKIESLKERGNKKQNRYFIKQQQQPTTKKEKEIIEKVKPIPNIVDPLISNENEIKLQVLDNEKDEKGNNDDNDEDNSDNESLERKILKKNSELNKLVEQYPNNEELWIELVKFQENFQQFSNKQSRSKIAMYEKQLSIYRNSLLLNPDSELLTIEYLKLASKLWNQEKVFELWNKLILKKVESSELLISEKLWREYLEFSLSNFNEFKINKIKETIQLIIKKLLVKRRSFKIYKEDTNYFMNKIQQLEETILQFILQLTSFLNQAGFSERVIGIYQSLIEFNCFEPFQLSNETQATLLKEFKRYWSSTDFPKIGEQNSIGWSKSYTKLINQSIISSNSNNNNNNLDNLDNLSIEEIEKLLKEQEDNEEKGGEENIFNIIYTTNENREEDGEFIYKEEKEEVVETSPLKNSGGSVSDKLKEWGKLEIKIGENNWKPLNVNDLKEVEKEINQEDTERVVLFNDFYELLFRFVKEENKIELVFQFLEFLGVSNNSNFKFQQRFPYFHPLRRDSINNSLNNNEINIELLFNGLKLNQQQQQQNTDETNPNWVFSNNAHTTTKLSKDRIEFIELVYKLILENSNGIKSKEKLYISYILFKASIDIEDAKKYTKSLCEKFKQQLIYFDIFATLEFQCGNIQESKKVYQATCQYINQLIQQQKSSGGNILYQQQQQQQQMIDLIYREYLFLELNSIYLTFEKDPQILKRFIKNSNFKPIEMFTIPLYILQCYLDGNYKPYSASNTATIDQRLNYLKYKFNSKLEESLKLSSSGGGGGGGMTIDFILCYCVFELLLNGFDGFLLVFKEFIGSGKYFKEFSTQHELLTIKAIEMVTLISPLIGTEPWKIKNLIIDSLNLYYDHPKLLTLFLNWESKNQLINRIRVYFDLNSKKLSNNNIYGTSSASCIFWLFSIKFESNRLGAAQRIKSLFEKSISNDYNSGSCRHSIILWKLYIEFEINRGRLKVAKAIYYRAIKELPWSKLIWLLPFTNNKLSSLFSENELFDLIKLINEKGIRLRQDFPITIK